MIVFILGVFLHILADTLGSVAVITSSLIIQKTGWLYADPICSIFLSILISASVIPLLKESALVLLNCKPHDFSIPLLHSKLRTVSNLIDMKNFHVWENNKNELFSTMHVTLKDPSASAQTIQEIEIILKGMRVHRSFIQLDTNRFKNYL